MIDAIGEARRKLDGVYFDNVNGFAGTIEPIGTPEKPVNNLADAKVILAAKGLSKLYLVGSNATAGGYVLVFDTDTNVAIEGNPLYDITVDAGITVNITSDLVCGAINSPAASQLFIFGDAKIYGTITNAGILTYRGIYPETAIDTTATNAAETDIFNLATANYKYTVDKLRLKSADPGANTVTVRLYELINGALTEVDSFAITTVNYGTYFSLMDMFGEHHLAGDKLKVTVRASAGGPYAVTGSYCHRSE